jgi:hypothetical protein
VATALRAFRGCSSLFAVLTLALATSTSRAEFTTIAGWDGQLFPSFAVATATLRPSEEYEEADESEFGDARGLLGVEL